MDELPPSGDQGSAGAGHDAELFGQSDDDILNPDPIDNLIPVTKEAHNGPRALDFVRARFRTLRTENAQLRARVEDLEQTLSIVQTAQEWATGTMTQEQQQKMHDIRSLLEQAKRAREDATNFTSVGKQAMYEKLRITKNALKKERDDKREMKERLVHAFDRARVIKEQHQRVCEERVQEREGWQELLRTMKERHRQELRKMKDAGGAFPEGERNQQASKFEERMMEELSALQHHLDQVKQETVDGVILEGDEEFEDGVAFGGSADVGAEGVQFAASAGTEETMNVSGREDGMDAPELGVSDAADPADRETLSPP